MPDNPPRRTFIPSSNLILAVAIILILGVMIIPLPTFMMDFLLVMNITGGLVMLFMALYIYNPLEFSVFPGLLLIVTLFRLSLNVATTRLILGQGYAGEIIEGFGSFVVQGNYVVGTVIFLILVIINFVVITKGATRVAEVSARFTLDAMPGKQMAIDADLNAGLIDDVEARDRRETIGNEADFYGAMDGAAKFVRGDAVAGLLITMINIIGGLSIGILQYGMTASEAAATFMLLTIGDGLVAQIPALIISTASGIIITRAASGSSLGSQISAQVLKQPKAVMVTAVVLAFLGFVPGLPLFPFMVLSVSLGVGSYLIKRTQDEVAAQLILDDEEQAQLPEPEEKIEEFLHPDPFEIEIGYGLIPLVDTNQGGNLLKRISTIRKNLALEMGVVIPPIRIRDNIQLQSNEYMFKIHGIKAANGNVMMDYYLVLNPDDGAPFTGIPTKEPTFNLPAMWISEKEKEKAEVAGYTTVEPPAVIATHLMEILKASAHKLLDRQETQQMLDHLKNSHAAVVEGLVPDLVPLGVVTQVLKYLLTEKIPIRNLVQILETIADYSPFSKDPEVLTEYVRTALAETITETYKLEQNQILVATLDPQLEDQIINSVKSGQGNNHNLGFSPQQVQKFFEFVGEKVEQMVTRGFLPTLLVSPQIRRHVRKFIQPILPNVSVLSYTELTADTNLQSVGVIGYPHES